jgi:hypothetical protein
MSELSPTMKTREQLYKCLSLMELFIFNEDHKGDAIDDRIVRISFQIDDRLGFRIVDWMLTNNEHNTVLFQNIVYHMIEFLEFPPEVEGMLIFVLLGDNKEFIIPEERILTKEISDMIYKTMVQEHLEAWRDGYFEPEDLSVDELAYHTEFVEYAKNNDMM